MATSKELFSSLSTLAERDKEEGIRNKFRNTNTRAQTYSRELSGMYFDFSKTHISSELIDMYESYAKVQKFQTKRQDFFSGEKINLTENRSVLHALLRDSQNQGIQMSDKTLMLQAEESQQQLRDQHAKILERLAARAEPVKDIIHVGIGGSSLGTQLLFEALRELDESTNIHFVGNIDAHQLISVLAHCDISSTLVIGVSKTFNTAETRQNIRSIGEWYENNGGQEFLENVYAVTANPQAALEFGVPSENTVTFPNWVGGRYSVWSSVSLSAAIVLGMEKFEDFLAGAAEIDRHFYQAEPRENMCFLAAMLDHYYANFWECGSRAIFAYDYRLRSLVSYLQQLETESNGKDRQINGEPVDQKTSVPIWGGVGTDVQHSVFQMLHQGTAFIPTEFILVANADHELAVHQTELLANGVAQSAALLAGQDLETVQKLSDGENLSELTLKAKVFSGNRPSTTIVLNSLNPHTLGALLAFYEHRTFCNGVFANINPFDQMGVELGKRLAKEVSPLLQSNRKSESKGNAGDSIRKLDPSTQKLIETLNSFKK